jgi:hypothetical protein
MDRTKYEEAKVLLRDIQQELATQPLTKKQRDELQLHATRLSGLLLRPWFPMSWTRRLVMAAIVLLGVQQAWVGNYQPMVLWLFLPLFSPRIMGECAFFLGRFARPFARLFGR